MNMEMNIITDLIALNLEKQIESSRKIREKWANSKSPNKSKNK